MDTTTADTWTMAPVLGPTPHFHADPAAGGAPLLSADGRWWWDGQAWGLLEGSPV